MAEDQENLPAWTFVVLRVVSSVFATAFGILLGWYIGELAFQLVAKIYPADKIGSSWGTGVAAAVALWKASTGCIEPARGAWRYITLKDDKFDHFQAMISVATISFGLTLAILSGSNILHSPQPVQPKTAEAPATVELVYVVSHSAKEAPSFLFSPTLIFKSASLTKPDMPVNLDLDAPISQSDFLENSVSLSSEQMESASRLIARMANCIYDGADELLELIVLGFANDLPIRNSRKQKRPDSDRLNTAVANFRGEAVYEALKKAISEKFSNLSEELVVRWNPWSSYSEMMFERDKVFRNIDFAFSPEIDHRSAVIVVSKPGTCPSLIAPNSADGVDTEAQRITNKDRL